MFLFFDQTSNCGVSVCICSLCGLIWVYIYTGYIFGLVYCTNELPHTTCDIYRGGDTVTEVLWCKGS